MGRVEPRSATDPAGPAGTALHVSAPNTGLAGAYAVSSDENSDPRGRAAPDQLRGRAGSAGDA
jgi:hypothetical protein